jgi:hypothetical protein
MAEAPDTKEKKRKKMEEEGGGEFRGSVESEK